jgi:lipopolysaccharide biosynthesis glycosyltransferase
MDRLLLPDLLPHLDRVIYLDVDILLRGDLAALWSLELGDRTLAGKSSTDEAWRCGHNMVYRAARQLPRDKACRLRRSMHAAGTLDFPAFNAGVVVMNLARMRRDGFASFAMPLITHYGMNDQDVLNVYARFDRLELDIAWNAMPSRDVTDEAKLLHFAGPIKPWSGLYILRRELFEACRQAYLARTRAMAST